MINRSVATLIFLLSLTVSVPSIASTGTLSEWAFTDQIIDSSPSNELTMSAISKKDIYIFTRWEELEITFYEVEARIFDGDNNLVGYSTYGFKPDKPSWDSWTRYHFRPGIDQPGEWRFEVSLNGSKVLEEIIYVEE